MTDAINTQAQSASSDGIWGPAFKEAGLAFVAAALLLSIFYILAFRWIHPEFVPFMDREASKVVAPGKDLIPVSVGGYRVEDNSAIIEDFNGDEAIMVLPRSFQAENYPFIKVNLQGFTRYSKFKILWRRAEEPSQTHALEFNRSGEEATQIAMVHSNKNYHGQIMDIALLFYDRPAKNFKNNDDVDIVLKSIELRPFSASRVAEQIYEDWTNPPLWGGHSSNVVPGIHGGGLVSPNFAANLLLFTGLMLVWVRTRTIPQSKRLRSDKNAKFLATVLCICLFSWAFSDIFRWAWRVEQLSDSHERYAGRPLGDRIKSNDIRCARFPETCASHLEPF